MSGGGQGSNGQGFGGQQSYGGFGQQGMGYGGFGQGYGGFGGFQTPYAPQQFYGGFQTPYALQQAPAEPTYGTFNQYGAKDLQDYVSGLKTAPAQTATAAPAAAPSMTDLASASGNSGNAAWDKLVTDYTASHPIFQPGQGWAVNDYTKQQYQGLVDQYNKQNAATAGAAATAVPTLDSAGAQNLASAMQQYGVSAHDLAQSGALSQADYTRAFRPGNQYQGVTNPTQYYQPIYQSQYQNYTSPNYYGRAYQNNMRQGYQSPLSGYGYGGYNAPSYGYGGYNAPSYGYGGYNAPSYGSQGIDGLLGQLGGYLQQYLNSYMKSAPAQTAPTAAPAQTTTTTASAPAVSTPAVNIPAVSTPAVSTPAVSTPAVSTPAVSTPAVSTPAKTTTASTPAVSTPAVSTPAVSTPAVSAPAVSTPAAATPAPAPATYGNQNFTAQQVTDWVNQQIKDNPDTAAKTIADAAKQYGISNEQLAELTYAGGNKYTAAQIGDYLGNVTKAAQGGLMSLMRRR